MERPRSLHRGDFVHVERTDGYITAGKFVGMNDDFITVRDTDGDYIHVPVSSIVLIKSIKVRQDS